MPNGSAWLTRSGASPRAQSVHNVVGAGHEPWQPVRVKWWIVVLVLGVLLAASGTGIGRSSGGPGEITCGSEIMGPGDVCEETRGGVVTDTYTYAEKLEDEKQSAAAFAKTGRWVVLGVGLGLIVIATVGIVLTKRRRARRPATSAALHLQQHQAAWQHQAWQHQQQWHRQPVTHPVHNHPPHASGPPAGPAGPQQGPGQNTETPYRFRPGTTGWK